MLQFSRQRQDQHQQQEQRPKQRQHDLNIFELLDSDRTLTRKRRMHQTLLDPQFGGCRLADLQNPFQFTSLCFRISGPQNFRWPISQHSILTRAKCGESHEQMWSEAEAVANETFQENFLAQDQHYFGSLSPDIRSLNDWLVRPFFFDCDMLTALSLSGTWQSDIAWFGFEAGALCCCLNSSISTIARCVLLTFLHSRYSTDFRTRFQVFKKLTPRQKAGLECLQKDRTHAHWDSSWGEDHASAESRSSARQNCFALTSVLVPVRFCLRALETPVTRCNKEWFGSLVSLFTLCSVVIVLLLLWLFAVIRRRLMFPISTPSPSAVPHRDFTCELQGGQTRWGEGHSFFHLYNLHQLSWFGASWSITVFMTCLWGDIWGQRSRLSW